jgi:AraC-like DNA-binding protein
VLVRRLAEGDVGIVETARHLHMSAATLRRRLAEEGTTYRHLLEQSRCKLALELIEHRHVAIGEIAFLLGFSSQSAFGKAFRRWMGASPLEYRTRHATAHAGRLPQLGQSG